ncbi:MAG: B12-binding domain-containing protein, partial [Flavobacteriales bacterium]
TLALNDFKMAMLNFDQYLFEKTYNKLLATNSFRDVFLTEFLALLGEIGNLWTTNTIDPMHERFISTLIKQKILVNIERVQTNQEADGKVFVLFTPLNEVHDIGLLYLHFELILKGYRSIFLGTSIPTKDLHDMQNIFKDITYVSYFTVEPAPSDVNKYLRDFEKTVLKVRGEKLHVIGNSTSSVSRDELSDKIKIHDSLTDLIDFL